MFDKIVNMLGGGLVDSVMGQVNKYFPPDMTPQEKASAELAVKNVVLQQNILANKAANEIESNLNKRVAEQEGTAKDLLSLPIVGRLVLFLRGTQRPLWGFFTMYIDYVWFTSSPAYTEQQQTALIVINFLVLGFLFGERTIKNLEPLLIKMFSKK